MRFWISRLIRTAQAVLIGVLLNACASVPGRTVNQDPWQGMNRAIYKFNDGVDHVALKPVANAYRKVTPTWVRTGVTNFFSNLGTPWTMINQGLQGKPNLMAKDGCRFVVNTVLGLGGFIDVAERLNLESHNEDFGQTLAIWGVPSGPYVMLPLLGPSTLRDSFGKGPDYFGRPTQHIDIPWQTETAMTSLEVIQTRENLLSMDERLNQTYDPYIFVRDAWIQRREFQVYDGNPPITDLEEDSFSP